LRVSLPAFVLCLYFPPKEYAQFSRLALSLNFCLVRGSRGATPSGAQSPSAPPPLKYRSPELFLSAPARRPFSISGRVFVLFRFGFSFTLSGRPRAPDFLPFPYSSFPHGCVWGGGLPLSGQSECFFTFETYGYSGGALDPPSFHFPDPLSTFAFFPLAFFLLESRVFIPHPFPSHCFIFSFLNNCDAAASPKPFFKYLPLHPDDPPTRKFTRIGCLLLLFLPFWRPPFQTAPLSLPRTQVITLQFLGD